MATQQLTFLPQGLVSLYQPLLSWVSFALLFSFKFLCYLRLLCQLSVRDITTIPGQRALNEAHISSLLDLWGDSLASIENTNMEYALVVIGHPKEGQPNQTSYLCFSGQHRMQVLLRRIAKVKRVDWVTASHQEEAQWICHIFNQGMSTLWLNTLTASHQDLLSRSYLHKALTVMQNTPEHVLQSTVLEKAFVELCRDGDAQPEELEVFYHHLRGNITSNYFLECAFHPDLGLFCRL